jgi:hypothetical protein
MDACKDIRRVRALVWVLVSALTVGYLYVSSH